MQCALRFRCQAMAALLAVCIAVLAAPANAAAQAGDYVIGPQDVLLVTVFDQTDLGGKYAVELDGSFSFPLIGRVTAGGTTIRDVEAELKAKLSRGFFKNPQVTVAIEQYRSQRVFIVGEVKNAGTYVLTGDMNLIEALAKAGSTTAAAGDDVVVVRGKGADAAVLPDARSDADVVRLNLRDLQSGAAAVRNIQLADGDTIYVPRAELAYVFGQVKNPGSYPVQSDTTVLQLLSLAGGVMPKGATNRVAVVRVVNGTKKEAKIKLTDIVKPGDTVVVPERFF
jgi:polysaccharide export outer membrane protein